MKDNFSSQAVLYAKYRPTYPKELFDALYQEISVFDRALDVGTGNGQVAVELASHFKEVIAIDISEKQLQFAPAKSNITYIVSSAEKTELPDNYFDLITVAQAIHWFDFNPFFDEVKRVAKDNARIAIWGYGLFCISEDIDNAVSDFYKNVIGPYWDEERKFIEEEYKTISFPLHEISLGSFSMTYAWSLTDLEGYLNTWSSVQKYIRQNGINPVSAFVDELKKYWKEDEVKVITFPIFTRIGVVSK